MRRWGAATVSAAALLSLSTTISAPARADDANAECANNEDITVVVDFQELGGGVNVRCAPQPVSDGFDAFARANIVVDQYRGFVCRIAGKPTDGPCDRYPSSTYYWVYWLAPRGGDWCYAQVGAGNRTPPPGSVEGWSFFKKSAERPHSTPPRYPVPAAIPGQAPRSLDSGDCASAAQTPPPTAAPEPQPPQPDGGSGVTESDSGTRRPASPRVTAPAAPGVTTSTVAAAVVAVDATTTSSIVSYAVRKPNVPYGDVDLTVRHHESKGSPVGFLAGLGAIGAVAAIGYVARRRSA